MDTLRIKPLTLSIIVTLLTVVHGNMRLQRMQKSINHMFSEIGKFRMDLSLLESRIDDIEYAIDNITAESDETGTNRHPAPVVLGEVDHDAKANSEKMKAMMGNVLKSLSKEKLLIRNMVTGLEKMVRGGSIGEDVEERIRIMEDKLKENVVVRPGNVSPVKVVNQDGHNVAYSFSARLDKTHDIVPDPNAKRLGHRVHTKRLQFADVIHNDGNVYNAVTGKFTCKKDGVYLFVFFVEGVFRKNYAVNGQTTMVALSVDGKYQTLAANKAMNAIGRNTAGNSVILSLVRGQQVWLETIAPVSQMITVREWVSTFSGTLLY